MEPKTESSVKYDDRRKVMVQNFKQESDIKEAGKVVGNSIVTREATFNEEGIRDTLKMLSDQRTKLEQAVKKSKEELKDVKELTPELKKLEENIQIINSFNKSTQVKSQLETQESELKIVKKDITDIKEAIGSRLKI